MAHRARSFSASSGILVSRPGGSRAVLKDLPMFALCRSNIAVENAYSVLIAAATGVTHCAHDDGSPATSGTWAWLVPLGEDRPAAGQRQKPGLASRVGEVELLDAVPGQQ